MSLRVSLCVYVYIKGKLCKYKKTKKLKETESMSIDFYGISAYIELFYAKKLGDCIHCTFIFSFMCSFLSVYFLHLFFWYIMQSIPG